MRWLRRLRLNGTPPLALQLCVRRTLACRHGNAPCREGDRRLREARPSAGEARPLDVTGSNTVRVTISWASPTHKMW